MAYDVSKFHFGVVDYCVFGLMLLVSILTGVWFGCKDKIFKKHQQPEQTLDTYLTGSKGMKPFPVAMSLVASYISGVTILGTPTEIYSFGFDYALVVVAIFLSGAAVCYVYLPVFAKLNVASSYEYLEMRFSPLVRTMISVLFVIDEILFLPMLIYVPSLAFNQVTGVNIHVIGAIVCVICVVYTILGGLEAVVWTDTLQIVVMIASVVVIVIMGLVDLKGPGVMIDRCREGKRCTTPNFSASFYERYTIWNVIFCCFIYWTAFNSVNQTMVQRYLSMDNLKTAQISIWIFTVGVSLFVFFCCLSGLIVYGYYHTCDPMMSGRIESSDQLFPLYVIEMAGWLVGIPGLFIAGVFGAALSSLSVVLHSTALVILEDFVKAAFHLNLKERTMSILVKMAAAVLGVIACALVVVVQHMGGIMEVATALSAIAAGTSYGVFSLGMLFPFANNYGAIAGLAAGAFVSATIAFGQQASVAAGTLKYNPLPVDGSTCLKTYGITTLKNMTLGSTKSTAFPLFRMSYLWVTPFGVFSVIIVGLLVSLCTRKTSSMKTIDPDLISPISQWMLPAEAQENVGQALRERETRTQPAN